MTCLSIRVNADYTMSTVNHSYDISVNLSVEASAYFLENDSKPPEERQSAAKSFKIKPLKGDRKGLPESDSGAFGISREPVAGADGRDEWLSTRNGNYDRGISARL
jgi:hypothetical protein